MESITVQEFNTRLNSAGDLAAFQDILFTFLESSREREQTIKLNMGGYN